MAIFLISTSQAAGISGMSHYAQPAVQFLKGKGTFYEYLAFNLPVL
jgi:hypothetical protein